MHHINPNGPTAAGGGKAHKGTLPGFMIEERKKKYWKRKHANRLGTYVFISNKANNPR